MGTEGQWWRILDGSFTFFTLPEFWYNQGMTTRQKESISKYFYDLSKGILLVGVVGLGTGKLGWYVLFYFFAAGGFFWAALLLEGSLPDAND